MKRVIIESPYAGDVPTNEDYAREAIRHSLMRGEAPIASHLLYTQPGILDDRNPTERKMGMEAGWSWIGAAWVMAFYVDRGVSHGMRMGLNRSLLTLTSCEVRSTRSNRVVPVTGTDKFTIQQDLDDAIEALWRLTGLSLLSGVYESEQTLQRTQETQTTSGQDLPRRDPSDPV